MPDRILIACIVAVAASFLVSLIGRPGALRLVAASMAGWLAAWLVSGDPWAGYLLPGCLGALAANRLG